MKRWKIVALTCMIVACMSLVLTGCQQQTYTPELKSQTVAGSALGKAGTLRVGVNASSAPLAGQTSSTSRIVGIDVDVASYIADELGVKVEIVDVSNDPAKALKDGNVDMVLGVDASDTDAQYWRSSSYLATGVALFGSATETSVPTTDSKPKVAAQASSKSSWRVTNLFGDDSLVSQSDLKSAFEALATGNARYVAADAVIGTYVSYSNGYSDKIVALMSDPSGYCAAIADSNTELQNAVGSAVDKLINGGMMNVIEKKWLGSVLSLDSMTVIKSSGGDKASDKTDANSDENAEEGEDTEGSAEDAESTDGGTEDAYAEGADESTSDDSEEAVA